MKTLAFSKFLVDTTAKAGISEETDGTIINTNHQSQRGTDGVSLWSYTVPSGFKALVHSLDVTVYGPGLWDNVGQIGSRLLRFGTLEWRINGATLFEHMTNLANGRPNLSFDGTAAGTQIVDGIGFHGVDVPVGQVVEALYTPTIGPMAHRIRTWIHGDTSAGAAVMVSSRNIVTEQTAAQQVLSYTVPAGGFNLKGFGSECDGTYFPMMVTDCGLFLDGNKIMGLGQFFSVTTRGASPRISVDLGGVEFSAGQKLEIRGRPQIDLDQTINVEMISEEVSVAAGVDVFSGSQLNRGLN